MADTARVVEGESSMGVNLMDDDNSTTLVFDVRAVVAGMEVRVDFSKGVHEDMAMAVIGNAAADETKDLLW